VTPQAANVLDLFRSAGAYLEGHFQLTSGLHSPGYLQSALVLQHPQSAATLGAMLAGEISRIVPGPIQTVVAPALGGLIIGHEVARALGARFLFTERDPATRQMQLRRGFTAAHAETTVVVEDVITTGGSTHEVAELLRALGAAPSAAGSIIDRSGGKADVGVPRVALVTLEVATYDPAACPLCKLGIPAVKPGSRPA
jgi:orotate phosphoribosyltransferase